MVLDFASELMKTEFIKKLKGGNNMETKSRYQVIAELEEQKRNFIVQRDNLDGNLLRKKKELKDLKRDIEDKEDEIKEFEKAMENSKKTFNTLIQGIDESLKRFSAMQEKQAAKS